MRSTPGGWRTLRLARSVRFRETACTPYSVRWRCGVRSWSMSLVFAANMRLFGDFGFRSASPSKFVLQLQHLWRTWAVSGALFAATCGFTRHRIGWAAALRTRISSSEAAIRNRHTTSPDRGWPGCWRGFMEWMSSMPRAWNGNGSAFAICAPMSLIGYRWWYAGVRPAEGWRLRSAFRGVWWDGPHLTAAPPPRGGRWSGIHAFRASQLAGGGAETFDGFPRDGS